jgi:pyruvate formate lyase activating enzyme
MPIETTYYKKPPIYDITPFTLQDFPNLSACILWFIGCNFRCLYCHNPDIVLTNKGKKHVNEIWHFLQSRQKLLEGVVVSGGECTLYPGLKLFLEKVRSLNFKIKLDTNGTNPTMIKSLCEQKLIDYIALDYKAPAGKFLQITKCKNHKAVFQTLDYLCSSNTPFEVRTTVHTSILNEDDINQIIIDLEARNFLGTYYLQNFTQCKTLFPLPDQKRELDFNLLHQPREFIIKARGFLESSPKLPYN